MYRNKIVVRLNESERTVISCERMGMIRDPMDDVNRQDHFLGCGSNGWSVVEGGFHLDGPFVRRWNPFIIELWISFMVLANVGGCWGRGTGSDW